MSDPNYVSPDDNNITLEQARQAIFNRLSHLWDFPLTARHEYAFRKLVTQTIINVLDVSVFPLDDANRENNIDAHLVADVFLEVYTQLLWPTHYNGDTNLAGLDQQRNIRQTIIDYVMNIFRTSHMLEGWESRELDRSLDVLRRPDPRIRANSTPDLGRPTNPVRTLSRRELLVEQIREWNREQARLEADEIRHARRHLLFDGYLLASEYDDDEDSSTSSRQRERQDYDDDQVVNQTSDEHKETMSDSCLFITRPTQSRSFRRQSFPGENAPRSRPGQVNSGERTTIDTDRIPVEGAPAAAGEVQPDIEQGVQGLQLKDRTHNAHETMQPEDAMSNWADSDAEPPTFEDDNGPHSSFENCPICNEWIPDFEARLLHVEKYHPE